MTKVSEVMDCINSIESTCNVSDWRINGLRIWPWARIRLSILIRDHDFVGPKVKLDERRGIISLVAGFLLSIFSFFELLLSPRTWRGHSIVVLTKPSGTSGGFNAYSSPLQEQMRDSGKPYLAIEISNSPSRGWKRSEPTLLLDKYWMGKIIGILYSLLRFFKRNSCHFPGYLSACKRVTAMFPDLGKEALLKWPLLRAATVIQAYRLFFLVFLGLLRPRKTLIICYYSLLAMGFILASRNKRALSADYQHGVQGKLHYAYGSWRCFPSKGYELLPDAFLTWSDIEKACIDQWAVGTPHRSISVGNLQLEHAQSGVAAYARKHKGNMDVFGSKPLALFTLQNFEPPAWIWDAMRDTSSSLKWLIRLHPLHANLRNAVYENLNARKGIDYDLNNASALPLPFLLEKISVHVTGNSSVVLDAWHVGKPSIIIDHYGQEYYDGLIQSGMVLSAFDGRQLMEALNRVLLRPPSLSSAKHPRAFIDFLDSPLKPAVLP